MLWVYRFLWIASSLGAGTLLIVASNPRREYTLPANATVAVQQGRFSLKVPAGFRVHRDALTQMGMNDPNSPIQLIDAVRVERGVRSSLKLALVTVRTDMLLSSEEPAMSGERGNARLLTRVHATQLQNLSKAVSNFKETKQRPIRLQGVYGLRTDYECTLTHWVPLIDVPVRGFLITVPVSQTEALHAIAYCPPHRFEEYQAIFEQILNTMRLNTAAGGER